MMNKVTDRHYRTLFHGLDGRRSRESALDLKDYIENKLIIEPIYWMGLSFRHWVNVETAVDRMASYFHKVSCHCIKGHCQTLIAFGGENHKGQIRNDIHVTLLAKRREDVDYLQLMGKIKRNWKHGRKPEIWLYDSEKAGIVYQTVKHQELGMMIHCNNSGSCKDKNKGRNDCIYRKDPRKLLR